MQPNIAIKVQNLSKKYKIGKKEPYLTFRDAIVNFAKLPANLFSKKTKSKAEFWALKNVSFEVKQGEVIGIIGENGAGKSTLLKILSRITEPTKGEVMLRGRVASLLEVGTGFNPELTGRENIFLNGSILGMTRKEIKRKFKKIVDFSGVEKFLDTPVKRYSSGMYVRLAFSIAAHLESEILLVDEVLAVGDHQFQEKCLGKMGQVAKGGKTVLFVSHNMGVIKNLCKKSLLLKNGQIVSFDNTKKIVDKYLEEGSLNQAIYKFRKDYNKNVQITEVKILNQKKQPSNNLSIEKDFIIQTEYEVRKKVENWLLSLVLYASSREMILLSDNFDKTNKLEKNLKPGKYIRQIKIPAFLLSSGLYYFDIIVHIPLIKFIDEVRNLKFRIISDGGLKIQMYKKSSVGILSVKLEHRNYKE